MRCTWKGFGSGKRKRKRFLEREKKSKEKVRNKMFVKRRSFIRSGKKTY